MAKFKTPKNFGGITHEGETFKADKRGGTVTLPNDFPNHLAVAHGLVPVDDPDDEPAGDSTDAAQPTDAGAEGTGA
ncbi:hypothetical protein [Paraburkholderia sacchari]|uniref:hypothetical protein n=1 Tax=Paraburkholderia sacchari TaxID=159450 RepID=UPI001BCDEE09|nr:hypothetical protein [Paraburkholderia sacchari]